MLKEILEQKDYLKILKMNDGTVVTKDNWQDRKREMLLALETYSYGKTNNLPVKVRGDRLFCIENAFGGNAFYERISIITETKKGTFSFPAVILVPKKVNNPPVFLHIAFDYPPHNLIPAEEIIDAGYALVIVYFQDIVNDRHFGDFSDGLAKYFGTDNPRNPDEWGKIGMWAYGISRVVDYLVLERNDIDTDKIALIGHSRLGKTALWCAAQDTRIAAVISNNSGYGGAASSKFSTGEKIDDFEKAGSWDWFCENFRTFGTNEDNKPYDQSFLLSLIAPRLLCVGSAVLDKDADPESEFLTTLHASFAWEMLGEKGLVCPDRMPVAGDKFFDGNVGYHIRDGYHCLTRADWYAYIDFLNRKWKKQ